MKGEISQGMLLSAEHNGSLQLLEVDKMIPTGSKAK